MRLSRKLGVAPNLKCHYVMCILHCSMNLVRFANWPDALYCLVGVAKDLHLNPRSVLSHLNFYI